MPTIRLKNVCSRTEWAKGMDDKAVREGRNIFGKSKVCSDTLGKKVFFSFSAGRYETV